MNVQGDVIFEVFLYDGTSQFANHVGWAVYFATKAGHLVRVLRSGDVIGVGSDGLPIYATRPDLANGYAPGTMRSLDDARRIALPTGNALPLTSIVLAGCQDGIDNDGNGAIDWDGGAAFHGGIAVSDADARCFGDPDRSETPTCGLGGELVLLIPLCRWARRRRRSVSGLGS